MPGLILYPCPLCPANFPSRVQTITHLRSGHNIVRNQEEVFQLMETGTRTSGRENITVPCCKLYLSNKHLLISRFQMTIPHPQLQLEGAKYAQQEPIQAEMGKS